jgi:putative heme-binding domain-containing protein
MDWRGLKLAWGAMKPNDLTALLDDARFTVRDRAIEALAQQGKDALPALQKALAVQSPRMRRNAIWAATRIEHAEARKLVTPLLGDNDLSVRLAAMHSVGLHRDVNAFPRLCVEVILGDPATRRQAATALGRIRNPKAIDSLMGALNQDSDRFLEHALIYALIQINDRAKTAPYLENINPAVRRAALIAIDQMPDGNLTQQELARQLGTNHSPLVKTALDIVASRPKWASEISGLLSEWLVSPNPHAITPENVQALLVALAKESSIQNLIAQALGDPKTPRNNRLLLVEAMGRANVTKLPSAWLAELGKTLDQPDDALVQQGIAAIRARNLAQFDAKLDRIVHDEKQSAETRVQAFGALAGRAAKVDEPTFRFLLAQMKNDGPPLIRLATAKGLSQVKLDAAQLLQLTKVVETAGPLEMPALLGAFEKNSSAEVGRALIAALDKSRGLVSLTPAAIERALQQYPDEVRRTAVKLIERLNVDSDKQKARLDELQPLTIGGSLEQGRDIFFGNKALCSACHAINNKGGGVGPDLGKIGAIRSGRDLLESIVFPSASFARGFEPYVVETKSGKTHTGILARESTDAIYLLTTERVEIRINRDEIETFAPGRVSIMPQGLDAQLSRRELQDLLAYLQSLR